jgi:hypothetical protein
MVKDVALAIVGFVIIERFEHSLSHSSLVSYVLMLNDVQEGGACGSGVQRRCPRVGGLQRGSS